MVAGTRLWIRLLNWKHWGWCRLVLVVWCRLWLMVAQRRRAGLTLEP